MKTNEEKVCAKMQGMANYIESQLPPDYGFVILAYSHEDQGLLQYASNSRREDVVSAMQEFIDKTKERYGEHDLIMVHGAMTYKCEACNKEWRMWLEVGVGGKDKQMPCPFTISCKCGGMAQHVKWHEDIHLQEPRPVSGENMCYFKLDREGLKNKNARAHGIPVLR